MAVAYSTEIGTSFCIESFAFKNWGVSNFLTINDFEVYMGYTDNELLVPVFEDNYLPGTRTLVLQEANITYNAEPGEWCVIELDTPFSYTTGHHLILEFQFSGGSSGMHNYLWPTPEGRALTATYQAVSGYLMDDMIHLLLTGMAQSLDTDTFGAIKVLLGTTGEY
jgi:hypothetical protein